MTRDPGQLIAWRLGAVVLAALVLHAAILSAAEWAWPSTAPPPLPGTALQVRLMVPAGAQATEPIEPIASDNRAAALQPQPQRTRPSPAPARAVRAAVPPAPDASAAPEQPAPLPSSPTADSAPSAAATPDDDEAAIPPYRTRVPTATTLRYEVIRGLLRGTAELAWRPQAERYELWLEFKLSGAGLLTQLSTGGFDAAGVAPLRFVDQRARRGTTAANFRRDGATSGDPRGDQITYSGSARTFALKPGAQDRLSWMLQLASIVAAQPQLALPGARVVMQVTDARGDAGLWVFRCFGAEPIDARGGSVEAIKFVREAREPYDATVQVWLDPKQQHLPVRATQKSGANDPGYELRLLDASVPN